MQSPNNDTHQRILDVAEDLFSRRGYTSVKLRDIASRIGIKHAALYYYAPGGKEALYMSVMERNLQRHMQGMETAIAEAGSDVRDQMRAVATWLLSQPPLNLARLRASDFLSISADNAQKLSQLLFDALRLPLARALERAKEQGSVTLSDPELAAISFVALIETVHAESAPYMQNQQVEISEKLIDMMLYGWLKR